MKLIVVDPRLTEYAEEADIWAPLRPGTYGALALAMLRVIWGFEEYFPWQNEEEAINEVIRPLGLTCEELMKCPQGVTIDVPAFLYKEEGF